MFLPSLPRTSTSSSDPAGSGSTSSSDPAGSGPHAVFCGSYFACLAVPRFARPAPREPPDSSVPAPYLDVVVGCRWVWTRCCVMWLLLRLRHLVIRQINTKRADCFFRPCPVPRRRRRIPLGLDPVSFPWSFPFCQGSVYSADDHSVCVQCLVYECSVRVLLLLLLQLLLPVLFNTAFGDEKPCAASYVYHALRPL